MAGCQTISKKPIIVILLVWVIGCVTWLDPVILQSSGGFSRTEINRIQKLVEEHRETLLESWDEFFNG